MKRRHFLKTAGIGLAAGALAKPALAQSMPEIKWRLAPSWPKSLDTLYGTCQLIAKAVAEATDNKFQIQVLSETALGSPLGVLDATSEGKVEMCHTASYYYFSKDPTFAFGTAVPFGLNSRQQNAWLTIGNGGALLDAFYKTANLIGLPAGNTGGQMGGWFRKEIRTVEDFKGLKMRIGGFAGTMLRRLGAIPEQIPAGETYRALEKGAIDATEWVGPYDDEKLGFHKVARYYYYPGWWEGSATTHAFINLDKWNSLPPMYRAVLRNAAGMANGWMQAKYDVSNPIALKRLIAGGAQLRPFTQEVLTECFKVANEVYAETSADNATFKRIYDDLVAFRADQYLWWQLTEYAFNTFQIRAQRS